MCVHVHSQNKVIREVTALEKILGCPVVPRHKSSTPKAGSCLCLVDIQATFDQTNLTAKKLANDGLNWIESWEVIEHEIS